MRRRASWNGCSIAVVAFLLTSCTDPVDKAAKQRIFSPEAPPKAVASAQEKLPPEQLRDATDETDTCCCFDLC